MHMFVDLKICESCGSLWYRAAGGPTVYCASCALKLGEFPNPRLRRRPGGRQKQQTNGLSLVSVAVRGGR